MTWREAPGERAAELEASRQREARRRRPFTREDLNTQVRVWMSSGLSGWLEFGRVVNIDEAGLVLVPTSQGLKWFNPRNVERGRVVETWEPEE
jgi:hypothetical protein